jgi:aminopeptidase N
MHFPIYLIRLLQLIALVIVLGACQTKKVSQKADGSDLAKTPLTVQAMKEKPDFVLPPQPYQATETKITDLIHTKLAVSFDWKKQYLFGEAELTLSPYFFPQNTLVLDAKGMDILEVSLVQGDDKKALPYQYKDSVLLNITLDKTYARTEKYKVCIKYRAKPNELKVDSGSQAISDDKGLYFINPLGEDTAKPIQIWTQGETESSSCWFPTIDQPNEKTTQEIAITVENKYITLSNGLLEAQMQNADGTRTDYWVQDKPHSPYLFMMAVGDFAVIRDSWKIPGKNQQMEVNYYVEPKYKDHAMKIFGNTPEMLTFFSEKLGYTYPWDKYSQVVVRDYVSGAMENTSASVFMEGLQKTDRELLDKNWDYIIAHELFHHWFGDLVTCESWGNLALNESFANYSEYLWYEHKFGKDYADAHRQEEMDDYLAESEKKQVPIVRKNYAHRMDMFDSHSYAKGGLVLHMLRDYLGDDAFFESLKFYLSKNEFTDAEIHELRLAFEEVTGQDLNWFFDQWFLSPGHPSLKIEQEYIKDTLFLNVKQTQDTNYTPLFKLPVAVEFFVNGQKQTQNIIVSKAEEKFAFASKASPEYVLFDANKVLLAQISFEKEGKENSIIYERSENYQARYDALDALMMDFANTNMALRMPDNELQKDGLSKTKLDSINTQILAVFVQALKDPSEQIRTLALQTLKGYDLKEKELLKANYQLLTSKDKSSTVRAEALANYAQISKNQLLTDQEKQVVIKAMADSSYKVVGEALLAGSALHIEEVKSQIDFYKDSDKANIIHAVGDYYVSEKDSGKADWVLSSFKKVSGDEHIELITMYTSLTLLASKSGQERLISFFYRRGIDAADLYERYTCYRILHTLHKIEGVNAKRKDVVAQEKSTMLKSVYDRWEAGIK